MKSYAYISICKSNPLPDDALVDVRYAGGKEASNMVVDGDEGCEQGITWTHEAEII